MAAGRVFQEALMLPPGQRARADFPRFGVPAFAKRLPAIPAAPVLQLGGEIGKNVTITSADLARLPRREVLADLHCVTTWTAPAQKWSGYFFRDVWERLILPHASEAPRFLEILALDGYRGTLLLEDTLRDGVLLADRLNDEPLGVDHGAPFRLIAPELYGYKNVKHVSGINLRSTYRTSFAERQTLAHPRGRVALEERGRGLPGWLWRFIYRALLPPTLWYYRRVTRRP
jgi:DMSO/TMAO reductase YedYZ molybdopterin-dependent catalytic subunit